MIYEIYTYGGSDYLIEVLNAIVRIMSANSFVTALKIFILFGFFTVICDVTLKGEATRGIKYYLSFLLLYNILFVPKVDVLIRDPLIQAHGDIKVDGVPIGLGFTAHVITTLGHWMTDIFGMNFALPNDLQYNKHGMLLGSSLVTDTLNFKISDITTAGNFNNYMIHCIIYGLKLGRINYDDLIRATSLQEVFALGNSGVLAYSISDASHGKKIVLCNDTNDLVRSLEKEISSAVRQQESLFNKKGNLNINSVDQYILGLQESTTKIFEQALIANIISDSAQSYLSLTGANAEAVTYAITKDNLQRKYSGLVQWLQAGKFLPLLKIIIEIMFYALFPVVILLTMLPRGTQIFINYTMVLLALQLWSPLYAILNLIMTLEQRYRISNLLANSGMTISLYNRQAILDINQGIQIQAGFLAFLIPLLSFKIITGMHGWGEDMASGLVSGGSYNSSIAASDLGSASLGYGNGSFKNISLDNIGAYKHDTNKVYNSGKTTHIDGDGNAYIYYANGDTILDTSGNRYSAMVNINGVNFTTSDDEVRSRHQAYKEAHLLTESYRTELNKTKQDLRSYQAYRQKNKSIAWLGSGEHQILGQASESVGRGHSKQESVMVEKLGQLQTAYNEALQAEKLRENELNYSRATSIQSGINWNYFVFNALREQGYSIEEINNMNQLELADKGRSIIQEELKTRNKEVKNMEDRLEHSSKNLKQASIKTSQEYLDTWHHINNEYRKERDRLNKLYDKYPKSIFGKAWIGMRNTLHIYPVKPDKYWKDGIHDQ